MVSLSNQAAGKNSLRLRASQKLSISAAASSTVTILRLLSRHSIHDRGYRRSKSTRVAVQRVSRCSCDNHGAFAIGFHGIASQMHRMVVTAQPRLELVGVVRSTGDAGIADILHGKEVVRRGEVDHDPVLGT